MEFLTGWAESGMLQEHVTGSLW